MVKDAGVNPRSPVWTPDGKRILFLDRSRIMEAKIGKRSSESLLVRFTFRIPLSPNLPWLGHGLDLWHVRSIGRKEIWTIPLIERNESRRKRAASCAINRRGKPPSLFAGWPVVSLFQHPERLVRGLARGCGRRPSATAYALLVSYCRSHYLVPDARSLAFHARLPKNPHLYVIEIGGGPIKEITRGIPGFIGPSWSKDRQTLYADALEGGANRTYAVPVAGGVPRLVFEGTNAIEVPGRNLLIYDKQDQPGIYGRSLTGNVAKNPEQLLVTDYRAPWGGFYPVSDGIYYVGRESDGNPRVFRFYSLETGKSVDIAPSPTNLYLGLTVTPDRTRLAYSTKSRGSEDLVQIDLQ